MSFTAEGIIAPLSKRPDVKYGCERDGLTQLPKSNTTKAAQRKRLRLQKSEIATAMACHWNARAGNRFLNPRESCTAIKFQRRDSVQPIRYLPIETVSRASSTSPRQKTAIESDQKTQSP